jgi:hypothetical protein
MGKDKFFSEEKKILLPSGIFSQDESESLNFLSGDK